LILVHAVLVVASYEADQRQKRLLLLLGGQATW